MKTICVEHTLNKNYSEILQITQKFNLALGCICPLYQKYIFRNIKKCIYISTI
jgi:hypothetical protein